ncbi:hypothetical protein Clacol_007184 [Clathrus columnatus]|uniref:Alpha/beta hydrolase fold-3 domain-containing protein n=1 Tax=Clathrus columnatus TaxID=1419009 RepID=A0AAV5AGT3_9AGAM|nr:hypothetical protein Clacol_007184 [Clathrus columnatus]
MTDVVEFRNRLTTIWKDANSQVETNAVVESTAKGVIIKNHNITVDEHLIPCRTYVPEIESELGETPGETFPLLFWLYGGGSLDDNDGMLRSIAVDLRITCVSVDYRKAPENPFPAAINDAYAGLKWVLSNAEGISVDILKGILVGGFSAGGNLTAVITSHNAYPDEYGDNCGMVDAYLGGNPENGYNPEFSPLLSSFEGLPAAYIQNAGGDPLRDEGFLYGKLLKQAGVTTKVDV